MKLSVRDAARILGKSERTARHLAQTGQIPAQRVGGRWLFEREHLEAHVSGGQTLAAAVDGLRDDVVEALEDAKPKLGERGFYSVRDVTAFKSGSSVLRQLEEASKTPGTEYLRTLLRCIADGFHQYDPETKLNSLLAARRAASGAVADLAHHAAADEALDPLVDTLEKVTLGSLRGLIRRAERRLEE